MITEFTCGIFKVFKTGNQWDLTISRHSIATIHIDGSLIQYNKETTPYFSVEDLVEIAVLMNNIKRQYKQWNN